MTPAQAKVMQARLGVTPDGNPGRAAANAAAAAVGGQVAFPEWPEGAPDDLTDFNDLANWKLAHVQA